ncbi:MAG TPA: DUF1592 domain-containing protein, partial [Candidatus Acidoferrum sp.]|nr:DUF1592 domain-containing protein [Candidatus Acidoferrum sp.]
PLGTRGGMQAQYVFPLDANYEFVIKKFTGSNFVLPVTGQQDPVEVSIDGARVALLPADKPARLTLPIKAGTHSIQVSFLHTMAEQEVDDLYAVHAGSTTLTGFDVIGPQKPSGPGDTESRRRIFTCYPKETAEQEPCARQIVTRLATRAWRAPVTTAAVDDLLTFYRQGLAIRGFDTGVQYAVARILTDPRFTYRFEHEPDALPTGASYTLDQYELASRLSFFLWSSIPDDELLRAAGAGELAKPAKLDAQVERMLADPRADAMVKNFAAQWLGLRALATINPTSRDYDGTLRESMRKETELLFTSILRENRGVLDLLDADYTFVDERLARHYGIAHVQGSHFRRIAITDDNRRGLLGQASILTLTSAPNRTSPVKRGAWILENVLGVPPPPPPPGVEIKLDQPVAPGSAPMTLRQRMEQHRANPSCSNCHGMIDPIGFALENFDAIGKWRDTTAGQPVNAVTTMWDGTGLNGAASLRQALLARGDDFAQVVIEKLLAYGVGRKVEYYDMPTVRAIARSSKAGHYRLHDLIKGVVASPAFRMRVKQGTNAGPVVAQER